MRFRDWLLGCLLLAPVFAAQALEFRSVAADAAILYDAPSVQSRKLFILSRHYPVEVIVTLDRWIKVRDASGSLAWVEAGKLSEKRTLLVTAELAEVRARGDANAPLVFQAERDVALELLEIGSGGWVKVKHKDGQSGFIQVGQVWGL